MSKVLFGAMALCAVTCGVASAADMALKAPVAAMSDRWTGWYFGLNAGYADPHTINLTASNSGVGGGFGPAARTSNTAAIPGSLPTNAQGGIAGAQIGYNFRLAPMWVAGIEADFDWTGVRGNATQQGSFLPTIATPISSVATATGSESMNWLSTVRGRIGALITDSFLVYGTGGWAVAKVSSTTTLSESGCLLVACTTLTGAGNASSTRNGWTLGGGMEWAINRQWSVKTEYLYVHLGSLTYANSPINFTPVGFASIVNTNSTANFNTSLVRVGINFKY